MSLIFWLISIAIMAFVALWFCLKMGSLADEKIERIIKKQKD